jgi:hypothetical protein
MDMDALGCHTEFMCFFFKKIMGLKATYLALGRWRWFIDG